MIASSSPLSRCAFLAHPSEPDHWIGGLLVADANRATAHLWDPEDVLGDVLVTVLEEPGPLAIVPVN